jgi:hypothetical protein
MSHCPGNPGSQQPAFSTNEQFGPGCVAVLPVSVVASAFQAMAPAVTSATAPRAPTISLGMAFSPVLDLSPLADGPCYHPVIPRRRQSDEGSQECLATVLFERLRSVGVTDARNAALSSRAAGFGQY